MSQVITILSSKAPNDFNTDESVHMRELHVHVADPCPDPSVLVVFK